MNSIGKLWQVWENNCNREKSENINLSSAPKPHVIQSPTDVPVKSFADVLKLNDGKTKKLMTKPVVVPPDKKSVVKNQRSLEGNISSVLFYQYFIFVGIGNY